MVVAKRYSNTFRKLRKITSRDNYTYYIDNWSVYLLVIPTDQYIMRKQHIFFIESKNSNTPKNNHKEHKEVTNLKIKLWVDFEDSNNFLKENNNFISILNNITYLSLITLITPSPIILYSFYLFVTAPTRTN